MKREGVKTYRISIYIKKDNNMSRLPREERDGKEAMGGT